MNIEQHISIITLSKDDFIKAMQDVADLAATKAIQQLNKLAAVDPNTVISYKDIADKYNLTAKTIGRKAGERNINTYSIGGNHKGIKQKDLDKLLAA